MSDKGLEIADWVEDEAVARQRLGFDNVEFDFIENGIARPISIPLAKVSEFVAGLRRLNRN